MVGSLQTTVVTIFDQQDQAEAAIQELRSLGFRDDQIGVAMRKPHRPGQGEVPEETTDNIAETTGFGFLAGASLGGIAGGTVLGLVSGGIVGGLLGALIGLGVPEAEANYYNRELEAGRLIVSIQANGRYAEALDVLRRHGGREASPPSAEAGVGQLP